MRRASAPRRRSVLLVDIDPQANASSGFGVRAGAGELTIYEVIPRRDQRKRSDRKVELVDLIRRSRSSPAPRSSSFPQIAREHAERGARGIADGTISSSSIRLRASGSSLNTLTARGFRADSHSMRVCSSRGLSQPQHHSHGAEASEPPDLRIEGVLLTMFDKRLNLSNQVAQEAISYFGEKVYETAIPRNALSEYRSFRTPRSTVATFRASGRRASQAGEGAYRQTGYPRRGQGKAHAPDRNEQEGEEGRWEPK